MSSWGYDHVVVNADLHTRGDHDAVSVCAWITTSVPDRFVQILCSCGTLTVLFNDLLLKDYQSLVQHAWETSPCVVNCYEQPSRP